MSLRIEAYSPQDEETWNTLNETSRNGTFLLDRRYMDYHSDRFEDASLLVFNNDDVVALLPANRSGTTLASHGGLTYGGFVTTPAVQARMMLDIFDATLEHLKTAGIERFVYKTIPAIYHRIPSEEDRYALFRNDARLFRRDVLTVVPNSRELSMQSRRKRGIKKAQKNGLAAGQSGNWDGFWGVLSARLEGKYDTRPVHTTDEIRLLAGRFPDNIRLHTVEKDGEVFAGVVMFVGDTVAHAQYISNSDEGQTIGALDLLFSHLLDEYAYVRWFDFGISNEQDGRHLNGGLVEYKESFGGRTVVHDYYEMML